MQKIIEVKLDMNAPKITTGGSSNEYVYDEMTPITMEMLEQVAKDNNITFPEIGEFWHGL